MSIIRDEDTTEKKEILFFSGAGAEVDYGISTGKDFLKSIIFGKYDDCSVLSSIKPKKFFTSNKITIIKDTLKKMVSNQVYSSLELFRFNCDNIGKLHKEINSIKWGKDTERINKIYSVLTNISNNNEQLEQFCDDFFNNICILNTIDGKFNSLIDYDLKANNYTIRQIKSIYYNAFLTVLNDIFLMKNKKFDISKFDFSSLYKLLDEIYEKKFVFSKINTHKSYYEIIKEIDDKCAFVTTNYTPIMENVIGVENVTHLHGELKYFENFKTLSVNSYNENKTDIFEENKSSYIPYLLVQSGVKPIICSYQINAFYDFIQKLNKCKYVIMVGYGFNGDDNHVNSILREYILKKDIKLIYFAYHDQQNDKNDTKLSYLKRLFEDSVINHFDFYTGKKNFKEIQNDLKEIFKDNTKKIFILKCLGKKANNEITIHEVMAILINLIKGGIDNL